MRIRKVLCPVDFSTPSSEALHFATDLARQSGASLGLHHVYAMPGYAFPEGIMVAGPEVLGDMLDEIERSLAEWRKDAQARGAMLVETSAVQGSAATEIVRFATDHDYDLIVVGTH